MPLKTVREEIVMEKPFEGLKDGGHVYPSCSNCQAILMDIWRTRPHEPETWKVKANCPFCGDESFTTDVKGGFHIGGYGVVKDDDPSSDVPSTKVDHFETEGETFKFFIVKARADAKPVRAR